MVAVTAHVVQLVVLDHKVSFNLDRSYGSVPLLYYSFAS